MSTILSYTTTDKVRGALGLTEREVTDSQMDNLDLALRLEADLTAWIPLHSQVMYSPDQQAVRYFSLYCTAFCSLEVCKRLALLSTKRVSDGKSEMERQPVDFTLLAVTLREDMRMAQAYLEANNFAATVTGATLFNPFMGVAASYNPVTNT